MKSKFLSLKLSDGVKAVILFFIMTVVTGIYQLIQTDGQLTWDNVKVVLISALGAAISYIVKNFLTNDQDKFLQKDSK